MNQLFWLNASSSELLCNSARSRWFKLRKNAYIWPVTEHLLKTKSFSKRSGGEGGHGENVELTSLTAALVNLFLMVHSSSTPGRAGISQSWHAFFIFTASPAALTAQLKFSCDQTCPYFDVLAATHVTSEQAFAVRITSEWLRCQHLGRLFFLKHNIKWLFYYKPVIKCFVKPSSSYLQPSNILFFNPIHHNKNLGK